MPERPLIIGAHMGGLARAQAEVLLRRLRSKRPRYRLELTTVSKRARRPDVHADHFAEHRGALRTLHDRLRSHEIDVVIHRGFDLRAERMEDLEVAAVLARSSPYEALLSSAGLTLDELDEGARVGVTQLRARVQLREYRSDLELVLLSGDVGVWLTEMIERRIEALIMPNAALEHLGLQGRVCEIFPPDLLLPSPGSGVLVCVARRDDELTLRRLAGLNDPVTAVEYAAELAMMDALGCDWESAVGALGQVRGRSLRLLAVVARSDGSGLMRRGLEGHGDDPVALGQHLADLLLEDGAQALLNPSEGTPATATTGLVAASASRGHPSGPTRGPVRTAPHDFADVGELGDIDELDDEGDDPEAADALDDDTESEA